MKTLFFVLPFSHPIIFPHAHSRRSFDALLVPVYCRRPDSLETWPFAALSFFHASLKRWTLVSFATQLTHHSWLSTALNFELHHPPSERGRKSWFDLHDNSSSTANLSSTRTAIDQLRSSFQSALEQCRGSLESLDFCRDFSPLQQVQSHHEKIEAWNFRD